MQERVLDAVLRLLKSFVAIKTIDENLTRVLTTERGFRKT